MSESVALFSKLSMTPEAFADAVRTMGGIIESDSTMEGRISEGSGHVWLYFQTEDLPPISEHREEWEQLITQGLGDVPRTNIVIDISRERGSRELAVKVASAFATKWPIVAYDLIGQVWSSEEILRLKAQGMGFEIKHNN